MALKLPNGWRQLDEHGKRLVHDSGAVVSYAAGHWYWVRADQTSYHTERTADTREDAMRRALEDV